MVARHAVPLSRIPVLDTILTAHAGALGRDYESYRNHAYRVATLCVVQSPGSADDVDKIAIAAAFHDLGIWTARTFDYLLPSVGLARSYLMETDRAQWVPEITTMIVEHHKLSRYRGPEGPLVEPFRRADWMDVSLGLLTFGLSRRLLEAAVASWPRAGFHNRLAQLALRRVRTHPWSPLPMVRL